MWSLWCLDADGQTNRDRFVDASTDIFRLIYSPERHTPIDLFPGTNDIHSIVSRHCEVIALMSREKG